MIDADLPEYLTSALLSLCQDRPYSGRRPRSPDILKRDPNNLEAHKPLGRIYLRSLRRAGRAGSQNVLKLAIDQYEQIIKIEPDKWTITFCWDAYTV